MDATRRTTLAGTVFSTWVVLGLFIDGWAHNAGKPEDFWTPWHAILYSGFLAAVVYFVVDRGRQQRAGESEPTDPLMVAGFVAFGVAGVGDAIWHGIFGIEEDVAALLSPTHLALMIGGLLLITGPLRNEPVAGRSSWGNAFPDVVAVTLATSVVAFFLQFVSPFHGPHPALYGPTGTEVEHLFGVSSILLTNALLVGAVAWATARRDLPIGSSTVILGGTALLVASLSGFAAVELVGAAVAAGIAADLLSRFGASRRTVLLATPLVLWPVWFAVYHASLGLGWPVEYWTGAVVLSVLTAWSVDLLVAPGPATAERSDATVTSRAPSAEVTPAVGYSSP